MVLFAENAGEGEITTASHGFLLLGRLRFIFLFIAFLSQATKRKQPVLSTLGLEISGNKYPSSLLLSTRVPVSHVPPL